VQERIPVNIPEKEISEVIALISKIKKSIFQILKIPKTAFRTHTTVYGSPLITLQTNEQVVQEDLSRKSSPKYSYSHFTS